MPDRLRRAGALVVAAAVVGSLIRLSSSAAFAVAPSSSHILRSRVSTPAPAPNPVPEPLGVGTAGVSSGSLRSAFATELMSIPSRPPAGVWAVTLTKSMPPGGQNTNLAASRPPVPSRRSGIGRVVRVDVKLGRGQYRAVLTNAPTIGDLISALRVKVGPTDRLFPKAGQRLEQGARVRLVRIRTETETVRRSIPYRTLIQYSKFMVAGVTAVRHTGRNGAVVSVFKVTYRNGKEVRRASVSSRLLALPVPQLVLEGAPAPASGVQVGTATWYACAGMHAAHLSLPLGTAVRVTDLDNGRTITVVINDRGPFAPGTDRIIDLCSPAFSTLSSLSQGTVRVRITW